jgi:hypothetical protein
MCSRVQQLAQCLPTILLAHHHGLGRYLKADGTILLVPEPEHVFTYQEGDQIIVFADDFKIKKTGGR